MGKAISEQEILYSFEDALSNGSIVPYYQPQINHSTGRMMGAEALIRWHHIVLGSQSPANFIPVLEAHDLIYKADLFIFESVCKFLRKCFDQGISPVPISVNMSRCDLYLLDYVREIERIRHQYEIPVRYLRIEITETAAIDGPEQKEGEPSLGRRHPPQQMARPVPYPLHDGIRPKRQALESLRFRHHGHRRGRKNADHVNKNVSRETKEQTF